MFPGWALYVRSSTSAPCAVFFAFRTTLGAEASYAKSWARSSSGGISAAVVVGGEPAAVSAAAVEADPPPHAASGNERGRSSKSIVSLITSFTTDGMSGGKLAVLAAGEAGQLLQVVIGLDAPH